MSFPIPENEEERLRELDGLGVVGAAPLLELQFLCTIASTIAKTPIAIVSLITEDEQVYTANVGLEHMDKTGRNVAFCAHTIMNKAPFVVGNAKQDKRFRNNPLVTGAPHIRAYAGIPLETAPNCRVGTLCVVDTKRRRFTDDQIQKLQYLAEAITRLLIGCRTQAQLAETMTEDKENLAQLLHAACHDSLTGVPNLRHFRNLAESIIETATSEEPVALAIIDFDYFKSVNDRYGHGFGDSYLIAISHALRQVLEDNNGILGRIGGDEFTAVFKIAKDQEPDLAVVSLVQHMQKAARMAAAEVGKPDLGSLSIGISLSPTHATTYEDLYLLADTALYSAKYSGRNRMLMFKDGMVSKVAQRSQRAEIIKAIEQNEFVPYYQPLFNLQNTCITGFEVLARWNHPSQGVLTPNRFEIALSDPVVTPILTKSMILQALLEISYWRSTRSSLGSISFNATTADLIDPDFAPNLIKLCRGHGLKFSDITIEVTERVVLGEQNEQVYASLARLRAEGAKIALDDFGTGYGGLQHLRSWPIDCVKIEKNFVKNCDTNSHDRAILRSIIGLCRELNLSVVAEGIETQSQADTLTLLGCETGQGFLFSPAMPGVQVPAFLDRNKHAGADRHFFTNYILVNQLI